jgi:hypothetical protein
MMVPGWGWLAVPVDPWPDASEFLLAPFDWWGCRSRSAGVAY